MAVDILYIFKLVYINNLILLNTYLSVSYCQRIILTPFIMSFLIPIVSFSYYKFFPVFRENRP